MEATPPATTRHTISPLGLAAITSHAHQDLPPPFPLRNIEESQLRTGLARVHIAPCERTRYFVNVLHEIQDNKKGPTFR